MKILLGAFMAASFFGSAALLVSGIRPHASDCMTTNNYEVAQSIADGHWHEGAYLVTLTRVPEPDSDPYEVCWYH